MNSNDGGGFSLTLSPGPTEELHRWALDTFVRLWAENIGGKYVVMGQRDGNLLKKLIRQVPDISRAEIERRMRIAFTDGWFQRAGSVAVFCSHWNNYGRSMLRVVGGGAGVHQPARKAQLDPRTGRYSFSAAD